MSARSAQRTRWRRWRMGWDIAGRIRSRRKTCGQDTSSREASRGLVVSPSSSLIMHATYRWVESEARRVLREVLNAREQERRQEVTPSSCTH